MKYYHLDKYKIVYNLEIFYKMEKVLYLVLASLIIATSIGLYGTMTSEREKLDAMDFKIWMGKNNIRTLDEKAFGKKF